MRTRTIARWLGSALVVTMAAPGGARAQQPAQPAPAPQTQEPATQPPQEPAPQAGDKPAAGEQAAPAENAPITQQAPPAEGAVQPVPGAPDEYTIQKGDTLWDLSQKFLENP